MAKKAKGAEAFEKFYAQAWGDRWEGLKTALSCEKHYAALGNPYFQGEDFKDSIKYKEFLPGIYLLESGQQWPEPINDQNGQRSHYFMDPASCLAAHFLGVNPGDEVLDLCAAPGGKSLILLNALKDQGKLVSNDRSRDRRERLKRVLNEHYICSPELSLSVTGHDASSWCLHQKDAYDKILLDAPCSSERHVLDSPQHLKDWGEGRTQRLSMDQWTMLASALDVVKVGGRILYSTCALSHFENEDVIEKLLKKRSDRVRIIEIKSDYVETIGQGHYLLPDKLGWGPIFFCLIERVA